MRDSKEVVCGDAANTVSQCEVVVVAADRLKNVRVELFNSVNDQAHRGANVAGDKDALKVERQKPDRG